VTGADSRRAACGVLALADVLAANNLFSLSRIAQTRHFNTSILAEILTPLRRSPAGVGRGEVEPSSFVPRARWGFGFPKDRKWSKMPRDSKQYRIFVVDDEPMIAETLGLILGEFGFEARVFTDPMKALEAASEMPLDLLITDYMMPVLTGIALAIRVRGICPGCKVLLVSGHGSVPFLLESARRNGHDFQALPKPVHPRIFMAKIHSIMSAQAASSM